ncbi:MAG: DNA repair protein RadC [Planctomycetota bacterium]
MSDETEKLGDRELLRLLLGDRSGRWDEALGARGGLRGLEELAENELREIPGLGPDRARRLRAAFEIARRLPLRRRPRRPRLRSSREVFELVHLDLRRLDREVFEVLDLDARNALCARRRVSMGTLTGSLVQPREVFRGAVLGRAAAVVVVHNHPSGDPSPSREDLEVTRRLVAAGRLIGIPLLDHVVVGDGCYVSLADRGLMDAPDGTGAAPREARASEEDR